MVTRYPQCAGKFCLDPLALKQSLDRMRLPTQFWGLANSIRCPVGMEPGSAWFLVTREDGDAIAKNNFHSLTWNDGNTRTIFQNYVLHRAVLIGLDGDGRAPYLLEFRDKRQVLRLSVVDREYNVRRTTRQSDTGTTDLYYEDTRNSGSDWTWQTMFEDVWGNLPSAIRGTAPTLATSGYVPVSEPENFRFHGSAWDAIATILAATQNVLCLDPITDTFTVQRIGSTQSGLSAAQSSLVAAKRRLSADTPLSDLNLSVAPATIRFFFPKRMEEEADLTESAAGGPLVEPYHTIDKSTGLSGAQSGTVLSFRTKFVAEIDADAATVNNSAALDALAEELKDKIVDRINGGTERGSDVYGGIVTTVSPGSQIHEMRWRDYGDDQGCVTEAMKNPALGYPVEAEVIRLLPITSSSTQTDEGIPIFNQSGVTIEAYRVLDVLGTVDIGGTPHLEVSYPTGVFHTKRIVNGSDLVPSYNGVGDMGDYTGRGFWRTEKSGPVAVQLDMTNVQNGDELGLSPNLASILPGALLEYCPGFTAMGESYISGGFRYVEARQRPFTTVFGKVRTAATQNAAGSIETDIEVWFRGSDANMRRAGYTIYARLPFLNKNDTVRAGTWARADWYSNYWEADPACDPDETDTSQVSPGAQQEFIFQGPETSDSTDQIQQGTI